MKNSLILAGLALATAFSFSSCKDDTQPRLKPAEEGTFKLYEPADNNYTYFLDPTTTITLTTSGQPDYGVATVTRYQVQISLDNTWKEAVLNEAGEEVTPATYYSLPTVGSQSVITVSCLEMALGINTLFGIHEEDDAYLYDDSVRPIYVRVRAYVADPAYPGGYLPYSEIYSNVMKLNKVQTFFVVPKPAEIYVIGDYQGWNISPNLEAADDKTVAITEEEYGIGSDIYTGYVYMTASNAAAGGGGFRFYKALGDWENNSLGSAASGEDTNTFELEDGLFEGDIFNSKANFALSNWEDGYMYITVNLNSMKITIAEASDYQPEK